MSFVADIITMKSVIIIVVLAIALINVISCEPTRGLKFQKAASQAFVT